MTFDFYNSKVDGVQYSIVVDSLEQYIKVLDYYRFCSLVNRIQCIQARCTMQVDMETVIKCLDAVHRRGDVYSERLDDCLIALKKALKEANMKDEIIKDEIEHAIDVYEQGGAFCYYRGVGSSIYPEKPGIFRNKYIREEDRWYREMKIHHQEQLDKKHYLDRLGLLQHYELPTRLLDVTSNPLVALYMTSNTIYTRDENREDIGEVIVYYDDYDKDEVTYGFSPVYKYDGRMYDSGLVLFIATLVKLKYEYKKRMFDVIREFQGMINAICGEYHTDRQQHVRNELCELVNMCIHKNANVNEHKCLFDRDEHKMIRRKLKPLRLHRKCKFKLPNEICRFLIEYSGVKRDIAEMESEYRKFISSYRYMLTTVRRENVAFRDDINVFELLKSYHVRIGMVNDRIQAQAGSFIIAGLDEDYINTKMNSSRRKGSLRLFVKNKDDIAKQLNAVGINDMTMIPDMAHLASYLKSQRQ